MGNLEKAVSKTMKAVFAGVDTKNNSNKDRSQRLEALKANLGKAANLPLNEIETDQNIRSQIDINAEGFLRLVESVKKYGILENIVVDLKIIPSKQDYNLVCVAGHRRILAAKMAGNIEKIPCLLKSYEFKGDKIGAALSENLNREDLHCLDVAEGYQELIKAGWSELELSNHFCRDIRTIRHYIKMAGWSSEIKRIIRNNSNRFTTRVLLRQFAYKKFNSMADLKKAMEEFLSSNKADLAKIESSSKSSIISINRNDLKRQVKKYLSEQQTLSSIIKDEIQKAFNELILK